MHNTRHDIEFWPHEIIAPRHEIPKQFHDGKVRISCHREGRLSGCTGSGKQSEIGRYTPSPRIRKVDLLGDMKFAPSRHEIVSGFHVGGAIISCRQNSIS